MMHASLMMTKNIHSELMGKGLNIYNVAAPMLMKLVMIAYDRVAPETEPFSDF